MSEENQWQAETEDGKDNDADQGQDDGDSGKTDNLGKKKKNVIVKVNTVCLLSWLS